MPHLCLSHQSVYVINMEDKQQLSNNFLTLQKATINQTRGRQMNWAGRLLRWAVWEQAKCTEAPFCPHIVERQRWA